MSFIPHSRPSLGDDEAQAVAAVVRSGHVAEGEVVGRFEKAFAKKMDIQDAVAVSSGTAALHLTMLAMGVGPDDEVIFPSYVCTALLYAVQYIGARPVLAEIEPHTYNIDPVEIEKAISDKTKAIIPVHFAGLSCNMNAIMEIAEKYDLTVIEDACHAHGGEYQGKKLGSIAHVGCFSFQSSKNLTSGEGGMAITNDDHLYELMNSLRNVGRIEGGQWYEHHYLGCNYRLTQLQASLLHEQLKRLDEQTRLRDENGKYLAELLGKIGGISPLIRELGETLHTYHIFIFRYDKSKFNNLSKREFSEMLAAEGVPCFMGYPEPLYKQPLFQEKNFMCYAIPEEVSYKEVSCPETEKACYEDAVWILQNTMLGTKKDMEDIALAIRKIQDALS